MNKGITHKELLKLHGKQVIVKHYEDTQVGRISVNQGKKSKERVYFCTDDESRSLASSLEVRETFGMKYARAISWNTPCGKIEDNYGRTKFVKVVNEESKMSKRENLMEIIKTSTKIIEDANKSLDRAIEALKVLSQGEEVEVPILNGNGRPSLLFNNNLQRLSEKNGEFIVSTYGTKGVYEDSREDFLWIKCSDRDLNVGDIVKLDSASVTIEGVFLGEDTRAGSTHRKISYVIGREETDVVTRYFRMTRSSILHKLVLKEELLDD